MASMDDRLRPRLSYRRGMILNHILLACLRALHVCLFAGALVNAYAAARGGYRHHIDFLFTGLTKTCRLTKVKVEDSALSLVGDATFKISTRT